MYPNSLDFERGSYTLVDPVQYETVHVAGKYGVKVNIRNVTPKDLGLYTCYVSNHLGSDYRSAFLSERTDWWKESEGESDRIVQLLKSVVYQKSDLLFIHLNEVVLVHFISVKLSVFFFFFGGGGGNHDKTMHSNPTYAITSPLIESDRSH